MRILLVEDDEKLAGQEKAYAEHPDQTAAQPLYHNIVRIMAILEDFNVPLIGI